MNPTVACVAAHRTLGEEVVTVDEVDVGVGHDSVGNTPEVKERMSKR